MRGTTELGTVTFCPLKLKVTSPVCAFTACETMLNPPVLVGMSNGTTFPTVLTPI